MAVTRDLEASPVPAVRLRAKVFWSGRSQAIRLPKELRLSTSEVWVGRDGDRLTVEPIEIERDAMGWPQAFWDVAGGAPEFDLGDRGAPHQRGDVLARTRRVR